MDTLKALPIDLLMYVRNNAKINQENQQSIRLIYKVKTSIIIFGISTQEVQPILYVHINVPNVYFLQNNMRRSRLRSISLRKFDFYAIFST